MRPGRPESPGRPAPTPSHPPRDFHEGTEPLMSKRIQAVDVDVFYGKFKAVEGVNIDIAPRSVTAFIGPSGCLLYTSPSPRDRG